MEIPDFTGSNNGMCIDGIAWIANFTCVCCAGYTGSLCEEDIKDNHYIGVLCANGGLCQDRVNGFDCCCNPGFEGALCEVDSNECININCSGRGTCVDGVNSFMITCVCESSYTGLQCETAICKSDTPRAS